MSTLLLTALLLILPFTATAQTIVQAPARAPGETEVVATKELWRVGGFGEEESDFFGYVADVVRNSEGLTFLLDGQLCEIKTYDAGGNYLYKFGRKGEGPGEFERANEMLLMPDGTIGLLHGRPPRIERFSPEGEILEHLSLGDGEGMSFVVGAASAGGTVVLDQRKMGIGEKTITTTSQVVALDDNGDVATVYMEATDEKPRSGPGISITIDGSFAGAWALGYDGLLHVSSYEDQYRIDSYDENGEIVRTIERPFERRRRTAEEIDKIKAQQEGRPGPELEIEEYNRDISDIFARPNGEIWVLDSHGVPREREDTLGTFSVFDANGELVRKIRIDAPYDRTKDRYYFQGDRLYVVEEAVGAMRNAFAGFGAQIVVDGAEEDEEEPQPLSVVCYRMDLAGSAAQ